MCGSQKRHRGQRRGSRPSSAPWRERSPPTRQGGPSPVPLSLWATPTAEGRLHTLAFLSCLGRPPHWHGAHSSPPVAHTPGFNCCPRLRTSHTRKVTREPHSGLHAQFHERFSLPRAPVHRWPRPDAVRAQRGCSQGWAWRPLPRDGRREAAESVTPSGHCRRVRSV